MRRRSGSLYEHFAEQCGADPTAVSHVATAVAQVGDTRAGETIEAHRREIIVSTQVLLELYAVCTRQLGMDREVTGTAVRAAALFPVVSTDRELILDAVTLATDAQLSVFDAAIVAAAVRAGCTTLLSEDLNDGQLLAGVHVRNPFASAA